MPRIRATVAVAIAAVLTLLAGCAAEPAPTQEPEPSAGASIVALIATQSDGPLGRGSDGIERSDADSLDAMAEVLALPDTAPEEIECAWSTRTTVTVTLDDGTTATEEAQSCGATGRDAALGLLVAEWVDEEG